MADFSAGSFGHPRGQRLHGGRPVRTLPGSIQRMRFEALLAWQASWAETRAFRSARRDLSHGCIRVALRFVQDIYGHDARLRKELDRRSAGSSSRLRRVSRYANSWTSGFAFPTPRA